MAARLLILFSIFAFIITLPIEARAVVPARQLPNSNWYRNGATLDLDFANDRYLLNGTTYSGVANFITGASATFTRAGTANMTSTSPPFYLDTSQGQAFVSRASTATYFDNTGTMQTASTDVARTNYTYNGSSWVNAGILIEPAATNLVPNSSNTTTRATLTSNAATSPDGTADAKSLIPDTSTNTHYAVLTGTTQTNGTQYTFSYYAKAAGYPSVYSGISNVGAIVVNLSTCAITYTDPGPVYSSTSIGNGWCYITETYTSNGSVAVIYAHNGTGLNYTGNGTSGIYIFGEQVEASSYATSYIPTTTAAVTRSADVYSTPSGGTYFNSAGVMKTALANTARLDHDPTSPYAAKGVLIEESRTNLLTYSSDYTNSVWVKSGASIIGNAATAPDSTSTAQKITDNTSFIGGKANITSPSISVASSASYTYSVYAKAAEYSYLEFQLYDAATPANFNLYPVFNLSNGTLAQANGATNYIIQSVGSGWYRVSVTGAVSASTASVKLALYSHLNPTNGNYNGTTGSGIYAWGAQLETGGFPTSYIPTSSSTVTRNADIFSIPVGTWYNATTGTFLADSYGQLNSTQTVGSRVVGANDSKSLLNFGSALNIMQTWSATGGTLNTGGLPLTASPTQSCRSAVAWNQGALTRSLTGQGVTAVTGSYTGDYTTTEVGIGAGSNGGASVKGYDPINASVRRITFFPTRQSDASLADYTR